MRNATEANSSPMGRNGAESWAMTSNTRFLAASSTSASTQMSATCEVQCRFDRSDSGGLLLHIVLWSSTHCDVSHKIHQLRWGCCMVLCPKVSYSSV